MFERRRFWLFGAGVLLLLGVVCKGQNGGLTPAPVVVVAATPAASGTGSAAPGVSPMQSPVVVPPAPAPTPSLLKKIGVKIQFLPPPMEGTISLGIYDHNGKLVRVLHREAGADEFVAALDGFITHWDGLDDAGHALPAGEYSGKGYMVGAVSVKPVPAASPAVTGSNAVASSTPARIDTLASALPVLKFPNGAPFVAREKIRVSLVANPLEQDRAGSAELSVAFDAKGSWLQLADGLPLKQISTVSNLKWAAVGRTGPGEPLVVFQGNGGNLDEFVITKVSNMMAFDCGDFEFTAPAKQPSP